MYSKSIVSYRNNKDKIVFSTSFGFGSPFLCFEFLIDKQVCQGETWKFVVFICFLISSLEDTMKFVRTEDLKCIFMKAAKFWCTSLTGH